MPKEQINYPLPPTHSEAPLEPEVSLHWSNNGGGYVQISFEFDVLHMMDYLKRLQADSPMDKRAIFYTNELGRPDLQRLIKATRRARDAVFDADE